MSQQSFNPNPWWHSPLASTAVPLLPSLEQLYSSGHHWEELNIHLRASSLCPMTSSELLYSTPKGRATELFKAASERLRNALPGDIRNHLARIDFPDFENSNGIEEKLGNVLESFVQARRQYRMNPNRSQVAKNTIRNWFRATYPFAQTFLTVAKAGAQVFSTLLPH